MLLKNIRKNKKREKGIALLFSLGILGLMTVLALTFASVSMTNQTIAKNNTERYAARELANSVLNRIMYSMANYNTYIETSDKLFSKEKNGPSTSLVGTYDWIWKLALTGDDKNIEKALFCMQDPEYTYDKDKEPTWQYILAKDEKDKNRIVARYAYKIIGPDRPLFPLCAILVDEENNKLNFPALTYERFGMSFSELDPAIWTDTILSFSLKPFFRVDGFDRELAGQAIQTSGKRFSSYNDLAEYIKKASDKLKFSDFIVNKAFTIESIKFPEAFYEFSDNDGTFNTSTKRYHRFNLMNVLKKKDEDPFMHATRTTLVDKMVSGVKKDFNINDDKTTANETTLIPWLKNWKDDFAGYDKNNTKYTYPPYPPDDLPNKKKQIAANIIDAFRDCEKETNFDGPTSDIEPTNWLKTTPKYTGNLKTPYISGIGAKIEVVITATRVENAIDPSLYDHTIEITPTVKPILELANMYDKIPSGPYSYHFEGEITFEFNEIAENGDVVTKKTREFKATHKIDPAIPFTKPLKPKSRVHEVNTVTKFKIEGEPSVKYTILASSDKQIKKKFRISNVMFAPKRIILKMNNVPIDYANTDTNINAVKRPLATEGVLPIDIVTFDENKKESTIGNIYILAGRRVFDPRHNLLSQEWFNESNKQQLMNENKFDFEESLKFTFKDLDEKESDNGYNNDLKPPHLYDDVDLPGKIMTTPGELGMVSRGAPWQTLNFKNFNEDNCAKLDDGAGDFEKGDLNLLDQIKVTEQAFQYGKVNVNEFYKKNVDLLKALLVNTSTETELSNATLPPILDKIRDQFRDTKLPAKRKSSPPFYITRGEFLAELATVLIAELKKDSKAEGKIVKVAKAEGKIVKVAKVEEIIGKVAMLLEAERTVVFPKRTYAVVIAQMIRDLGDVTIYKDWNNNGIITENAAEGMGYYNLGYTFPTPTSSPTWTLPQPPETPAIIPTKKGRYDNGADIILAEQKIFAVLEREYQTTPTEPKWKVVRMKYVE